MDEQSIFLTALEKSASERAAWLTETCGTTTRLRQRIDTLLLRHEQAGKFLETPPAGLDLENTFDLADADTRDDFGALDQHVPLDFLDPSLQAGSLGRIGAYEVHSVLGCGGMGIVLKAHDTRLNRMVAVKVLAPDLAANATARKRFTREAQAAAAITHPNVVTIHAVDEHKLPFIVMEFVDGISLREHLEQQGPLPASEIARTGAQIAAALAAAHVRGLIHRDIKPANILLSVGNALRGVPHPAGGPSTFDLRHSTVKVTDFGLARAADDLDLTQTGEIAGTPQYMSPEQAQGLALDARSDLFSLGSVLYAMCTGRSPFRADCAIAVIRRVCDEKHPPIREVNPEIPNSLCTLIDRLLAKNPADRIQTAQEVADLLSSPHAPREEPLPQVALPRTNPKSQILNPKFLLTAAAGFLLAALGVWIVIKNKQGRETARIQVPDGSSITIETDSQPKAAPVAAAPAVPTAERQAFVVLGGQGVNERKFDALSDAVLAASEGDTIEVRGNGPFVSDPITIQQALTIRAASGFRPVIRLSEAGVEARKSLMRPSAALVLEGLELTASGGTWDYYEPMLVFPHGAPVSLANCRLVLHGFRWMISLNSPAPVRLLNCELVGDRCDVRLQCDTERRLLVENCILAGVGSDIRWGTHPNGDVRVRVVRSTWATAPSYGQLGLILPDAPSFEPQKNTNNPAIEIDISRTVNAFAPRVLYFVQGEQRAASDVLAFLRRLMKWRGEHNVFSAGDGLLTYSVQFRKGPNLIKDLNEWHQFWGLSESKFTQGNIRFEGGDVLAKAATAPETLTPDDFRLRPDSAGYRAGGCSG